MKLKVNKSFSMFLFIALFLLFTNSVFAITGEELLNGIINASEVVNYVRQGTQNAVTSSFYVLETKYDLSKYMNEDEDALKLDDKEYIFSIKYTDSEGNEVELSDTGDTFVKYEFENQSAYSHFLKEKPSVTNVTYSLIPKDGNGSEITVTEDLKVGTNLAGEITPKEKVVSKIKRTNVLSAGWRCDYW